MKPTIVILLALFLGACSTPQPLPRPAPVRPDTTNVPVSTNSVLPTPPVEYSNPSR